MPNILMKKRYVKIRTLHELGETYENWLFKFFGHVGGVSKGVKFTVCMENSESNKLSSHTVQMQWRLRIQLLAFYLPTTLQPTMFGN